MSWEIMTPKCNMTWHSWVIKMCVVKWFLVVDLIVLIYFMCS